MTNEKITEILDRCNGRLGWVQIHIDTAENYMLMPLRDLVELLEKEMHNCGNCRKKADKYKWHDLRKNPDDLPEAIGDGYESEYVLVMIGTPEWNDCDWAYYNHNTRMWSTYGQNIFTWRYIEPFEENKDDE